MKKRRMRIMVVANQKGGVTKSTTAAHLGFFAAAADERVLVVDLDEGSVSSVFEASADDGKYLRASQLFSEHVPALKPRPVATNIDLIANDIALHNIDALSVDLLIDMEDELEKADGDVSLAQLRESFGKLIAPLDRHLVANSLARFENDYDLCIIDTPPNPSNRLLGALTAADAVLVPMDLEKVTLERIPLFEKTLMNVARDRRIRWQDLLLGYLPSKFDVRSKKQTANLEALRADQKAAVFSQVIGVRSAIPAALTNGHPVWVNARSGSQREAAKEMRAACAEVFARFNRV
ncbi:ParA family protein [Burkholderia vietnamiensis]|uniref:ParA family protein n=1 Tax=Burkholderia vietnamiensis TaxID=60552 RepID=UPI0015936DF1|nr:ParA family protein [Burkholderia vietnamiensis]MCA8270371.1 ParA family protein [Burkholderia vietnamiensis]